MTEDATRRLMAYDWPGNVRELENAIERAVALGSGPYVAVQYAQCGSAARAGEAYGKPAGEA